MHTQPCEPNLQGTSWLLLCRHMEELNLFQVTPDNITRHDMASPWKDLMINSRHLNQYLDTHSWYRVSPGKTKIQLQRNCTIDSGYVLWGAATQQGKLWNTLQNTGVGKSPCLLLNFTPGKTRISNILSIILELVSHCILTGT